MKKFLGFIVVHFSLFTFLSGQNENMTWIIGHQEPNLEKNEPDTGYNVNFGANILNFSQTPFTHTRYAKSLGLTWNVVNMCDKNGDLLFYSNGSKIFNYNHQLIENADSLNYTRYWNSGGGYYSDYIIGSYSQSMLCIPNPYNKNQFYLIANYLDWGNIGADNKAFIKVMYSILDMSENNGEGKLIIKEQTLAQGNFGQGVYGCKQANGKDWWIFVRSLNNTNEFYKMRIDKNGISLDSEREKIGLRLWSKNSLFTQGNFSHDGKHFAFISYKGVELFDFNRCTGSFSNHRSHTILNEDPDKLSRGVTGTIFSPNNKWIY